MFIFVRSNGRSNKYPYRFHPYLYVQPAGLTTMLTASGGRRRCWRHAAGFQLGIVCWLVASSGIWTCRRITDRWLGGQLAMRRRRRRNSPRWASSRRSTPRSRARSEWVIDRRRAGPSPHLACCVRWETKSTLGSRRNSQPPRFFWLTTPFLYYFWSTIDWPSHHNPWNEINSTPMRVHLF